MPFNLPGTQPEETYVKCEKNTSMISLWNINIQEGSGWKIKTAQTAFQITLENTWCVLTGILPEKRAPIWHLTRHLYAYLSVLNGWMSCRIIKADFDDPQYMRKEGRKPDPGSVFALACDNWFWLLMLLHNLLGCSGSLVWAGGFSETSQCCQSSGP